jgi:alpha-glucosidase
VVDGGPSVVRRDRRRTVDGSISAIRGSSQAMAAGDWWRHGVFYQVYPRSFQDSNGDGIGDLPGITSRLDHLNDGTTGSLGIDAIWLSPFYPSPMADFGYDVADYCDVHPDFGTLADFDDLVREAHRRGIRIVIDLVPNHTSDEHPWFVESRSSRSNPRRDWYVWADPAPGGGPPNGWRSSFAAIGPAWTLDEATGQYYLHSFHRRQPDLNWWNPEVRAAFEDILRFWLDRGVDGFRIDVVTRTVKTRTLVAPAGPAGPGGAAAPAAEIEPGVIDLTPPADEDETHALLRSWRRLLEGYPERMAVGETYVFDPVRLAGWYGPSGDELHLAFNFMFLRAPWEAERFAAIVDQMERLLPTGAWPDYTLSNHDNPRARSRYEPLDARGQPDRARGLARARVGMLMVLTLRGTPFIYYGEEIGQADVPIPPALVVDVAGRDPERAPMPWAAGLGAGFTTGRPWLPIGTEASAGINVEDEARDPGSMLAFTRQAIWCRRRSPALRHGTYRRLDVESGVYAFLREAAGERLVVLLEFEGRARRLDIASALGESAGNATLEVSTRGDGAARGPSIDLRAVELGGDEGLVARLA